MHKSDKFIYWKAIFAPVLTDNRQINHLERAEKYIGVIDSYCQQKKFQEQKTSVWAELTVSNTTGMLEIK